VKTRQSIRFAKETILVLEKQTLDSQAIHGRIDEQGRVLLPVIVIAADGLELELEALVRLEFVGAMAVHEQVARRLGWRRLGSRRTVVGFQTVIMDHYLGTIAMGDEPSQYVVLGGIKYEAIIGQKLLSGRQLKIDFEHSTVVLE
jgi:predicted aspartyl protease